MTPSLTDLTGLKHAELEALHRDGNPVRLADVSGFTFDGINLTRPPFVRRLTWTKFTKTFHQDPSGQVRGWNEGVEQNGLEAPWTPRSRRGQRVVYGHYDVTEAECGLTIRYSTRAGSPPARLDPSRMLFDPLVSLDPNTADLLLGYTYWSVGRLRLNTPTWFALRRGHALDFIASVRSG